MGVGGVMLAVAVEWVESSVDELRVGGVCVGGVFFVRVWSLLHGSPSGWSQRGFVSNEGIFNNNLISFDNIRSEIV